VTLSLEGGVEIVRRAARLQSTDVAGVRNPIELLTADRNLSRP
jgi:hypothetical protein